MIATARGDGYAGAARAYRKAGWQGVLPLKNGTKWPPPEGFTGRAGEWPAGLLVLEWEDRFPNGGVALRVPRGVVGIDVDCYGAKRGDETLEALTQRYGPLPPTWSSTSRGPGPSRILLFRCPEDLELPGAPGPSIEVIQHHHRYLVVWPSVVEGRRYRWYDPAGELSDGIPRLDELAWLPDDWHHLRRPPRPVQEFVPRAVDGDWTPAVNRQHGDGTAALKAAGGRHDAMLPVVMALVRLDNLGHPGAAEALDDLHARFVAAISDRSDPKSAESEWRRMEDGAADKVAATPSTRSRYEDRRIDDRQPPEVAFGDFTEPVEYLPPEAQPEVEAEPEHGWEIVDLTEYLAGTWSRPEPMFLTRRLQ